MEIENIIYIYILIHHKKLKKHLTNYVINGYNNDHILNIYL
jgi:hypothetical protein